MKRAKRQREGILKSNLGSIVTSPSSGECNEGPSSSHLREWLPSSAFSTILGSVLGDTFAFP